ncbi:MAG: 50S ribosomal protein L30 [Candidatus Wallbacteria bacterium]|nr:50S ribosomal protein L30 [Candidatus Wallbacteria bacterium]
MSKIKVTLKRSITGKSDKQRKIIESMGLSRIGQTRVYEDTPVIRGMINKTSHLLDIETE